MTSNSPAASLVGRFIIIIELLCRGLAQHAVREWTAASFVDIIVGKLRRRLARFVVLKGRFDAGLPPPPPRPVGERAPRDDVERAFDFVPRNRGWLKKTTEHDGAAAFWQLRDLLAEPEMAAFIAADPRVGRLLRPLWWMLSPKLALPDVLLPPRPPGVAEPRAAGAGPRGARRLKGVRRIYLVRIPPGSESGSAPPIPA